MQFIKDTIQDGAASFITFGVVASIALCGYAVVFVAGLAA